jgi:hypothetical protein
MWRFEGRMFFFEKKNQKTFATLGVGVGDSRVPKSKSFLLLFFKKEDSFLPRPHAPRP